MIQRVGSDPELFLRRNGEFVPAIGLVGGTKKRPKKHGNIGLQEDNVMVEFNIPPATTEPELKEYMHLGLQTIQNLLPDYELVIVPSAEFDPKYLTSKKARESGCDPDFDAWTRSIRVPACMKGNIRYGGAHVHFQLPPKYRDDFDFVVNFVRALDIYLAVPATRYDKDKRRRLAYGMPGAYREKSFGIEYRSLSNFWIKDYTAFVWDGAHKAFEYATRVEIPDSEHEKVIAGLV